MSESTGCTKRNANYSPTTDPHQISAYTAHNRARVLLACGESLEADLVVGADGINSTVADAIQPGA